MLKATSIAGQFLQENFWLAKSTRDTIKRAIDYFVLANGNREIDRIVPSDGENYKGWLLKTGRSKTTANIYLRAVNRVLNWSVETKLLIKANPLRKCRQFRLTRNPVIIYDDSQIERMLRFCPSLRWEGIIMAAYTTGLRRGAILNLNRDNIRNGFIFVEPKKNTKYTWEWSPKDKEIRKVPMIDQLKDIINQLNGFYPFITLRRYDRMIHLNGIGLLSEYARKCPDQNFRRTFVKIQRRAFGRQIGDFHRFRKNFTTMMCEELPAHFAMRLTGHNDLKTMTYYLACRESYYDKAREIATEGIKIGPLATREARLRKKVC